MKRWGWRGMALALLTGVGACLLPSDVSDEFVVELAGGEVTLTVGDTTRLFPTVTRDGEQAGGFSIGFASSDASVALVDPTGLVRAVGTGSAEVTASALDLANATVATQTVRVLRAVTIDTVIATASESANGRTVRWGEVIRISGLGLDPSLGNLVFVGDVPARFRSYLPAPSNEPDGFETLEVWVPVGAPEQSDLLVSRLSGSTATWTLDVIREDVVESLDRIPIDAAEGFENPELAIEVYPEFQGRPCLARFAFSNDNCWSDSYAITAPPSGEFTLVLDMDQPIVSVPGLVELTSDRFDPTLPQQWMLTPRVAFCNDFRFITNLIANQFNAFETQSHRWTLPMRVEPGSRHLFTLSLSEEDLGFFATTGTVATSRYGLTITEGYHSDLPPDEGEENDHCFGALPLDATADSRLLTFDNGWDIDWFEFQLPGLDPPAPTTGDESEPNGHPSTVDTVRMNSLTAGEIPDLSDFDYYTFFANAGDLLDIQTITPFETGEVTLDTFLQLYRDGQPLAFNDNAQPGTIDSRITYRADETGWYVVSVQDVYEETSLIQEYELLVRTLGASARRLQVTVTSPEGLPPGEFTPVIQLAEDERELPLAAPDPLRIAPSIDEILLPGKYMLMIYNKVGQPAEYRLQISTAPVG